MPTHRAKCQDCHESYTDDDLLKVSEWAEDHKRTEVHDVRIERAVATDGGSEMHWDDEHCPRDDCDGELQHQDQVEVMCLACKKEWSAAILRGERVLVDSDGERVSSESQGGCHE